MELVLGLVVNGYESACTTLVAIFLRFLPVMGKTVFWFGKNFDGQLNRGLDNVQTSQLPDRTVFKIVGVYSEQLVNPFSVMNDPVCEVTSPWIDWWQVILSANCTDNDGIWCRNSVLTQHL